MQAILINGKGSINLNATETETFTVVPGGVYRMRVICALSLSYVRWSMEGGSDNLTAVIFQENTRHAQFSFIELIT